MILQTSLWQFAQFTFTNLGPAFANWTRNWYWSLPGKSLIVIPSIWRSPPTAHRKRQTPHWPWKMNPPIFMGERRPCKVLLFHIGHIMYSYYKLIVLTLVIYRFITCATEYSQKILICLYFFLKNYSIIRLYN